MRRLRLLSNEEQMLREAVRGMLIEAGMGDVRRDDGAGVEGELTKLYAAQEERRSKTMSSLPQAGTVDKVFAGLGFTSDVIGIAMNFIDGGVRGKLVNALADALSVTFAMKQLVLAGDRYEKVLINTDLSPFTPEEREDILFVYNFDYMVAKCIAVISWAALGASFAAMAGVQIGTGAEIFIKGFKWIAFGVSAIDSTAGSGSTLLAGSKAIDSATQAISTRIEEINRWVNGPMLTSMDKHSRSALAMIETQAGQAAVAAASAKLVMQGAVPTETLKKCLDEIMPKTYRDEMLDWLSTVRAEAAERAK